MESSAVNFNASLIIEMIGFGVGVALLWLGATLKATSKDLGHVPKTVALVVSVLFIATGLWWPAHWHNLESLSSLAALAVALPLVPFAGWVASSSRESQRKAVFALAGFGVTVLFTLLTRESARVSHLSITDMGLAVLMSALLFAALTVLHAREVAKFPISACRGAAAVVASLIVNAINITQTNQVPWPILSLHLSVLGLMAALVSVLLLVMHQAKVRETAVVAAKDKEAVDNDPLTRMPTRRAFEASLRTAAKNADREKAPMALLFIDLDGFKAVNDSYGHADGDRLLVEMSSRLRRLARDSDIIARVGADEMLLLMHEDVNSEAVKSMAEKIIQKLSAPYRLQHREVALTCSLGIARYPKHGPHDQLIGRADAAAQTAKREGGGRFVMYDKRMETGARERLALTSDLRAALERGEFELYYQPKVDASSLQITAAEALVRWHHPTRGMVGPGVFIPIAEQSGLIQQLGDWVIEDACRQASKWRDMGLRMRVAINLSVIQIRNENIVTQIVGLLKKYKVDASQITCEITESVAMGDAESTQKTFEAMGRAGLHLSIDDFGTGYSSLSYLRRLPAEEVKIDRSFVMDLEQSEDARAVADAVVKLAHALGKKVVAEGVETQRQAKILIDLGCNQLQGYLYGKPMPASELTAWAMNNGADRTVPFRDSLFMDIPPSAESARRSPLLH